MGNGRGFARNLQPAPAPGQQANAGVRPAPVPLAVQLTQFTGADGSLGVAVEVSTPVGVAVYFLSPEGAKDLGEKLVAIGTAGVSGLVVPA